MPDHKAGVAEREGAAVGPATDSFNRPVVDPTENVMKLVEAASKRTDDLAAFQTRWIETELRRVNDIAVLRAEHSREIRHLESDRLEKIRQVDVTAVKTEADRALAAIQTLAATTATNAETLRNALTTTAATIAKQTSDTVGQLIERIAALEKANYENQGRSKVADPQIEQMIAEMRRVAATQQTGQGERRGKDQTWGYIAAAFGAIIGIVGLILAVLKP